MTHYHQINKILTPKEEIFFCYTVRKDQGLFRASILRRKKIGRKRKVWSNYEIVKTKVSKSKKRVIKIAEKWFNQYINRRPRKVKVILT